MKRRSITRPDDLILFTDEDTGCLPHHCLPKILIDAGLKVECFEEHFTRRTPDGSSVEDHEWLSFCGERRWLAVTKDKRIRLQDASTIAIVESNTQVLTLIGDWTHEELATNLVNSIYVIDRKAKGEKPPCILKLHMAAPAARKFGRAGKVEVYRDHKELRKRWERIAGTGE